MSDGEGLMRAIIEDPDDDTPRRVYADWLDEQGEHEEADRQRKWPAAREWLVRFCKENGDEEEYSFEGLIAFGREAVKEDSSSDRVSLYKRLLNN